MRVLMIGAGAREHAMAWKIAQSSLISEVYGYPGSSAMGDFCKPLARPPKDVLDLPSVLKESGEIDFVVVGPEGPLAMGLADKLAAAGIPVFGPNAELAQLESSKTYAKSVMTEAGIPTAGFAVAKSEKECRELASQMLKRDGKVVLKASGLAAGKGVFVCQNQSEVEAGLDRLYRTEMKGAATEVLIEQFLEGRECSYFVFLGNDAPTRLGFAVDYKRRNDGDIGPNTGGMGCYTPVNWLPADAEQQVISKVVEPLVRTLKARGQKYVGCLYVGLMWGPKGLQVVEFNVRLGDPEAQILAVADNRDWAQLIAVQLGLVPASGVPTRQFRPTVGVVMTSAGYPYEKDAAQDFVIEEGLFGNTLDTGSMVFGAAVEALDRQKIRALSGRVLTVVAPGRSIVEARTGAYDRVAEIRKRWYGAHFRTDIGLSNT